MWIKISYVASVSFLKQNELEVWSVRIWKDLLGTQSIITKNKFIYINDASKVLHHTYATFHAYMDQILNYYKIQSIQWKQKLFDNLRMT